MTESLARRFEESVLTGRGSEYGLGQLKKTRIVSELQRGTTYISESETGGSVESASAFHFALLIMQQLQGGCSEFRGTHRFRDIYICRNPAPANAVHQTSSSFY